MTRLPRTGISSGTLRSAIEYGLRNFSFYTATIRDLRSKRYREPKAIGRPLGTNDLQQLGGSVCRTGVVDGHGHDRHWEHGLAKPPGGGRVIGDGHRRTRRYIAAVMHAELGFRANAMTAKYCSECNRRSAIDRRSICPERRTITFTTRLATRLSTLQTLRTSVNKRAANGLRKCRF